MNTSDLVVIDLVEQLWKLYKKDTVRRRKYSDDDNASEEKKHDVSENKHDTGIPFMDDVKVDKNV